MDLPSRHLLYLTKKIGPRGPGTDGETAAASYILHTMSESKIDVDMESFKSHKSDFQGLLLIYLLSLVGYAIFPLGYVWSIIVSIIVFFSFQMETYTWCVISRLLPRSTASNVIGRVAPTEDARKRVVIVANYDTAKSSPLGRRCFARAYRFFYVVSFVCITLVLVMGITGMGLSLAKVGRKTLLLIWIACSPFPLYILILALAIIVGEAFKKYTRGANDNASGVAVMLSILSSISVNPLEKTEVWGVATARGNAGGRGMIAFLRRHRHQMKDALIINIDHAGVGKTKLISREGAMFGFRSSRYLKRTGVQASSRSRGLEVSKGGCRVKKSDAMVSLARGRKAITVGGVNRGTYPGWRSSEDIYEKIDRDSLDSALKLVNLMLDRIDTSS